MTLISVLVIMARKNNKYIYFGEKVKEFDVGVLNEREVIGSAWIFFFLIVYFINFINNFIL